MLSKDFCVGLRPLVARGSPGQNREAQSEGEVGSHGLSPWLRSRPTAIPKTARRMSTNASPLSIGLLRFFVFGLAWWRMGGATAAPSYSKDSIIEVTASR